MSNELEQIEAELLLRINRLVFDYSLDEKEVERLNAYTKLLDTLLKNKNYAALLQSEQLKILYQSTKDDITQRKGEGIGEES